MKKITLSFFCALALFVASFQAFAFTDISKLKQMHNDLEKIIQDTKEQKTIKQDFMKKYHVDEAALNAAINKISAAKSNIDPSAGQFWGDICLIEQAFFDGQRRWHNAMDLDKVNFAKRCDDLKIYNILDVEAQYCTHYGIKFGHLFWAQGALQKQTGLSSECYLNIPGN